MDYGKSVKQSRVARDLTQAELAKKAKVSISYISKIESGEKEPSLSAAERIANALNIPLSLMLFLGMSPEECSPFPPDLARELSTVTLNLLKESNHDH